MSKEIGVLRVGDPEVGPFLDQTHELLVERFEAIKGHSLRDSLPAHFSHQEQKSPGPELTRFSVGIDSPDPTGRSAMLLNFRSFRSKPVSIGSVSGMLRLETNHTVGSEGGPGLEEDMLGAILLIAKHQQEIITCREAQEPTDSDSNQVIHTTNRYARNITDLQAFVAEAIAETIGQSSAQA